MPIRIEKVTKRYEALGKRITALDNVELFIRDGEFVAVMGKSGSGKSTLLNLLSGMDRPNSGNLYVGELCVNDLPDKELARLRRKRVGVIYQFYNLIPELNVRDNITLPVELDGRSIDEKKLQRILDRVGLSGREKDFPSALSGGQQQRVAIARALFEEPEVILADEPTGNLDEENTEAIMSLLCELNKEFNITLIVVTHSKEVANMASRTITLEEGRVKHDDYKR